MKKILLPLVFLLSFSRQAYSQATMYEVQANNLSKFSKKYFRSDPFTGEFSGFLNHLINDPKMTGKLEHKKTDTSFYSFAATYTTHNPFGFEPKRLEVVLEETPVRNAAGNAIDTLFVYQLMAFVDDDAKSKNLLKEFEAICRQASRKFGSDNYREIKQGEEIIAKIHDYTVPLISISPLTIAQGKLKEERELVLSITIRFKLEHNEVVLPISLK